MIALSPFADHLDVEMRISNDLLKKSQPKWQKHLRPACAGDVAKIDNVLGLPAEPGAEMFNHFFLGRRVVATDEQVVIARHA